jgi:hypothetical protein
MTEEPILGDVEARMLVECFDQKFSIPQRDRAMREGG